MLLDTKRELINAYIELDAERSGYYTHCIEQA